MAATTKDLLLNPEAFFREKMIEDVNLKVPALIVVIVAVIGALSAVITTGPIIGLLPPEAASAAPLLIMFSGAAAFIFALVFWVVWTLVFFVISMIFKGTGDFKRLLEFVGYGYIPQIFGSLLTLPIIYSYFSGISLPPVEDPTLIQEAVQELTTAPQMQIAVVIGLVFLLWSANIWIFGAKTARGLSMRDAVITVGCPIGIFVIIQLYNLFFAGGF